MTQIDQVFNRTLVVLTVALCFTTVSKGLDADKYLVWAKAIVNRQIGELAPSTETPRSCQGVPFHQWSAGPGLLTVPALRVSGFSGFAADHVFTLVGALCAAIFWLNLWIFLRELFAQEVAVYGMLLAFLATPLGYYSRSISSEAFMLFPVGVLLREGLRVWKSQCASPLSTITATASLLMIRPFLGAFAWPVLWLVFGQSNGKKRYAWVLFATLAMAAAIIQIGLVHSWMTGSWRQSPYSWGDDHFRSLDYSAPFVWNVIFDPFHGLIPSHPLVGCGAALLPGIGIYCAWQKRWSELFVWFLTALAVGVNVYFVGCYYYWWMSDLSFAMRGLTLVSVPALLAYLKCLERLPRTMMLISTAFGVWSTLVLFEAPFGSLTVLELLMSQVQQLREIVTSWCLLYFLISLVFITAWLRPREPVLIHTVLLLSLLWTYLIDRCNPSMWPFWLVAGIVWVFLTERIRALPRHALMWANAVPVTILTLGLCEFVPFAWSTQRMINSQRLDTSTCATYQRTDVLRCYGFLIRQARPDFAEQARELGEFLIRQEGALPARDEDETSYDNAVKMLKSRGGRFR